MTKVMNARNGAHPSDDHSNTSLSFITSITYITFITATSDAVASEVALKPCLHPIYDSAHIPTEGRFASPTQEVFAAVEK